MGQTNDRSRPTRLDAEQVVDFVREALLVLDSRLHVLVANRPFYEKFQVAPAETIGKHVFALGSGQWDIAELRTLLDCVASEGVSFEGFEVVHDFDRIGKKRMLLNARKVHSAGNGGDVVLLAFEDLTRRTVAEERLDVYEGRFRLIFESVKDFSIFTTDLDGTIDSWNAGAENVFGYPEGEILGRPYATIFTPEDRAKGADKLELAKAAKEGRANDERWHLRKDGSRFFASGMVRPLLDEDGSLIGFTKVARDITDQRRAEETLLRSEEFNRRIVESSPDCLKVIDLGGNLLSMNANGCRLMEIEDINSCLGRPWTGFWPPKGRKPVETALAAAREGKSSSFQADCPTAAGTMKSWDVAVIPILDPEGRTERILSIARDITAAKEAERLLESQADELRQEDRRKDEFLAMLAHELRNPLAAIAGTVNLFRVGETAVADLEWGRQVIDRQVTHLTRLIDDLLDVSRISTGKIHLRRETIDLRDVIMRATESLRPLIESKRHGLGVSLPEAPLPVEGDPARLQQAIGNLLANAAKYTDKGGRIDITATLVGGMAEVRVRDDGVGIPAEMLPRIFGLFTQIDSSLGRSQGGLGIGLSLVRTLVEMHDGSVAAESGGPGRGSEFIVRLPVLSASHATTIAENEGPDRGVTPEGPPRSYRILVVDDNEDTALAMSRFLKRSGHEVMAAHDGPSALEVAAGFQPRIILLDIGLPGMTGHELAQILRRDEAMAGATIIAISGYGQEKDLSEARESGFDYHMIKPLDMDRLLEMFSRL